MITYEIKKILKLKVVFIPLIFTICYLIYSMVCNGEFGYEYASNRTSMSELNRQPIYGKQAYEQNKKTAEKYQGTINDALLEKVHHCGISSKDNKYIACNTTYQFFEKVFYISKNQYLTTNAVWKNKSVNYGFTGDWEAYLDVINAFFTYYIICVVIFAAPVFTYEKENNMAQQLCTVKKGGEQLLWHKMSALFCVVNLFLFLVLISISIIHFSQYGFSNADVSIQCSEQGKYAAVALPCTMGQLTIYTIITGILGCNVLLLVAVLVSMVCNDSLNSFLVTFAGNWLFSYAFMHFITNNTKVDYILSILPVNICSGSAIIVLVSSWQEFYFIQVMRLVLFSVIFFILWKFWKSKRYFRE